LRLCLQDPRQSGPLGQRSIAWSNIHTTAENKAYLRNLAMSMPLTLGDVRVLLVHGSPRKINEYLYENRPDASFERLLDQAQTDVLVCGHTHLPYHKVLPSGRQSSMPAASANPKDGDPRACYAVLTMDGTDLTVDFAVCVYVESMAPLSKRPTCRTNSLPCCERPQAKQAAQRIHIMASLNQGLILAYFEP
jgi:diadenosine tetraphosphatase ApaH/serine/threonine PP2A family protein phosphatase